MGILIVIIVLVVVCWPWISRWFRGFLARRTEDYLRKATGMPPRPGSREAKRQAREQERSQQQARQQESYAYSGGSRSRRRRNPYSHQGPIIPKEYAEDVEFVEMVSYSENTIGVADNAGNAKVYHESQVSDVEWVEIKKK